MPIKAEGSILEVEKAEGTIILEVLRGDGTKEIYYFVNRIVAQGREYMLRNTIGVNTVNINYIYVSNHNQSVSDNETNVPGTFKSFKAATKSMADAQTAQWNASWSAGELNGQTIYSFGLAAANDGTMLFSRVHYSNGISFGSEDTLNVTYKVKLQAS